MLEQRNGKSAAISGLGWQLRLPGGLRSFLEVLVPAFVRRRLPDRLADVFGLYSVTMSDPAEPRVHLVVSGRVQGVGFRAWVLHRGLELRVRGWVRNCRDGSVEVEAAGPLPALLRLRKLVEDGPPLAHVLSIREEAPGSERLPEHFQIR